MNNDKNFPKSSGDVIDSFHKSTKAVIMECYKSGERSKLPGDYVKDVRKVFMILEGNSSLLPEYVRVLMFVLSQVKDREVAQIVKSILTGSEGEKLKATDIICTYLDTMNPFEGYVVFMVDEFLSCNNVEEYIRYMGSAFELYRHCSGKRVVITDRKWIWENYGKLIVDRERELREYRGDKLEERRREFNGIIKAFVESVESFSLGNALEDGLGAQIRDYEAAILTGTDEETLKLHFDRGLFDAKECDRFILSALNLKRMDLIPLMMSYKEKKHWKN